MRLRKAPAIAPIAAGAAMLGVCCGLPLLASVGVLGAIAGVGLGSWLIVAAAAVVVVTSIVRWRRTGDSCRTPGLAGNGSPLRHVLSPTNAYRNEEESR